MTDKNEFINGESISPEARILAALDFASCRKEDRPIFVALWTGDLRRFEDDPPQVFALAVRDTEKHITDDDGATLWEFEPVLYRGPAIRHAAADIFEQVGNAGGKLDKITRQLAPAEIETLRTTLHGAGLALIIDLIGTEKFNDGGALHIVWIFNNGLFCGGDVTAEKMKNELLEAGEELYTENLNASETEYTEGQ